MNCIKSCLSSDLINDKDLKNTIIDFLEILARHSDNDVDDTVIEYVKSKLNQKK
jgi:hypothetical protein